MEQRPDIKDFPTEKDIESRVAMIRKADRVTSAIFYLYQFRDLMIKASTPTNQQRVTEEVKGLEDSLEEAIQGLSWRITEQPETVDKSDYEKLDEWTNILDTYRKSLSQLPEGEGWIEENEVYSREECVFEYCSAPNICREKEKCQHH